MDSIENPAVRISKYPTVQLKPTLHWLSKSLKFYRGHKSFLWKEILPFDALMMVLESTNMTWVVGLRFGDTSKCGYLFTSDGAIIIQEEPTPTAIEMLIPQNNFALSAVTPTGTEK